MRYDELAEFITTQGRIVTTTVDPQLRAVKVALTGSEDGLDGGGESSEAEVLYGNLGMVARPRNAVRSTVATDHNPEGYAEFLGINLGDQVQPIATYDARLSARFPNPKEGEIAMVGYAGGFLSLADTSDLTGTRIMMYAPHMDGSGDVDKAHVFMMDPEGESVLLAHADGMAVTMYQNTTTLKNADGSNWIALDASYVRTNASSVFNHTGSFMVYVPNALNTAAHVFSIDDNDGHIVLMNRNGAALIMNDGEGPVLKSPDGTLYIQVGDSNDQITISGNLSINGGVNLGSATPTDAVLLATQQLAWNAQVVGILTDLIELLYVTGLAVTGATAKAATPPAAPTLPVAVPAPAVRVKAF